MIPFIVAGAGLSMQVVALWLQLSDNPASTPAWAIASTFWALAFLAQKWAGEREWE